MTDFQLPAICLLSDPLSIFYLSLGVGLGLLAGGGGGGVISAYET